MKATITANGGLKVQAENELESWALKCWWASYREELPTDKGCILIETTESSAHEAARPAAAEGEGKPRG